MGVILFIRKNVSPDGFNEIYHAHSNLGCYVFFSFFFQLDFFSEMGFIEFINFVLVVKREEFPRIEARSKNIKETIYFLENESRHTFY